MYPERILIMKSCYHDPLKTITNKKFSKKFLVIMKRSLGERFSWNYIDSDDY